MENFELFATNVKACMGDAMTSQAFRDPNALFAADANAMGGRQVFGSLVAVLLQYVIHTGLHFLTNLMS